MKTAANHAIVFGVPATIQKIKGHHIASLKSGLSRNLKKTSFCRF